MWHFDFNEHGWFYMWTDDGKHLGEWAEIPPDDWPQPKRYPYKLLSGYRQSAAIGSFLKAMCRESSE